ncbi:helix-turn-helix transcriptional regulator [Enterobacter sp. Cy-643]|uniref:winged helix-turn-helix transcriptional regulator n=1 Tax=Enterobacter sp. Cy-643 TaxID=2608346 RepID=UPI0014228FA2|nr:helix-turn-helix domain-containing protein [Enterobacter sp. Cy-643]NIF32812.1 helix-turn-helix transcriptional regulator [Enterobacter sp. Cy-643]
MEKLIHGRPYKDTTKGPMLTPCAPNSILVRLGDKWTILVMSMLALSPDQPMRFSAIKHGIPAISQRMLTLTLRNLERDGLVLRHYYAEVPPRVEYQLTLRGKTMLPALEGFTGWIKENWQAIEESRRVFDAIEAGERESKR